MPARPPIVGRPLHPRRTRVVRPLALAAVLLALSLWMQGAKPMAADAAVVYDDDKVPLSNEIYAMVIRDRSILYGKVREALHRYLDNPERCHIELVPAEPSKLLGGGFKEITLRIENTTVKNLHVQHAWIRLRNCVLDLEKLLRAKKFRFKDEGQVDVLLIVKERDVNELFQQKRQKLKLSNPRLDFLPGQVRFEGGLKLLLFRNRVRVGGKLHIVRGREVHFHPRFMNYGPLPVPGFVMRTIAKRVNPMATFDKFKIRIRADILETTHDTLYIASASMADTVGKLVAAEAKAREDGYVFSWRNAKALLPE